VLLLLLLLLLLLMLLLLQLMGPSMRRASRSLESPSSRIGTTSWTST